MSRVAKKIIPLPSSVSITESQADYCVNGSKGFVNVPKFLCCTLSVNDNSAQIEIKSDQVTNTAKAGLLRSLLNNAVIGVTKGFTKILELKGLGYRCNMEGKEIVMSLGFSHKIRYIIPNDVTISTEKDTIITITGVDKQRVGQVASEIRAYKIPDNYHAKGILYQGEKVITKEGKKK